jgi:HEAT repeat protein
MRNRENNAMRIILSLLAVSIGLGLAATPAEAGRGSSYSQIKSAIATGNADVIAFELERAERLVCGACIEPVMALLDSDDARIREVAAWWFARRAAQKEEIHDLAVARLYGDDMIGARNAADWLGTFRHPKALPALEYAATRTDLAAPARAAVIRALGTIAHPAGEATIVSALADGDAKVRREAVHAYWSLRGARDGAPLAARLGDADAAVRAEACSALGQFAYAPARAALETTLAADGDVFVRRNAAYALGRIGDPASKPALLAAQASDPSSLVRGAAKAAIANLQ